MTLGERLARLRNQRGLSQDALAEKLGVSDGRSANGRRMPACRSWTS